MLSFHAQSFVLFKPIKYCVGWQNRLKTKLQENEMQTYLYNEISMLLNLFNLYYNITAKKLKGDFLRRHSDIREFLCWILRAAKILE